MDASYLSQQVNTIIDQLHGLFDDIGVSSHDREARETDLFEALSATLNNQVKSVTSEKKKLLDEANHIITRIRQMEASLDGSSRSQRNSHSEDDELEITYPLTQCLKTLKEKHSRVSKQHRERFEQVSKLVQALESYSSHLEPSFVRLELPPTGPNQSPPPSFDLSPAYVDKLDDEFTRVYDEYTRRIATVQTLSENIIQLWAELGTPQAQTDGAIMKYYRDAPEQLGLHQEDLARLQAKRDKLAEEKRNRERQLKELRAEVEGLWEKLGIDEAERKAFLNGNRGCGVRQINEFEDELARLSELKRQNLPMFVEDARFQLQELWDALYLSDDEMLEFTPAFSDVYSDALLEAHEREIARLSALREQRAPTLALVERHRALLAERDELASSSQDASRLMARGQKGERRDPGKLLREEKSRKRIAKELPKVAADLARELERWEDEYGRPFLVHGERYLDILEQPESSQRATAAPGRPKTPGPGVAKGQQSSHQKTMSLSRANSAPSRQAANKTPTVGGGTLRRGAAPPNLSQQPSKDSIKGGEGSLRSPTRIPARVPLSNLKYGNNSPERQPLMRSDTTRSDSARPESRMMNGGGSIRLQQGPPLVMRAPPPKMRDLVAPELETPVNPYRNVGLGSSVIVRPISPEDVYDDRSSSSAQGYYHHQSQYQQQAPAQQLRHQTSNSSSSNHARSRSYIQQQSSRDRMLREATTSSERLAQSTMANNYHHQQHPMGPPPPVARQLSHTSSASTSTTAVSGSENWETYGDDDEDSEPEPDASDTYYAKVRAAAARNKRFTPEDGYGTAKRSHRGIPPAMHTGGGTVDAEGNRIISGSEWTDEDAF